MINSDLRAFIAKAIYCGSIAGEDMRELRGAVLETGIGSREEAEALLALNRALDGDPTWAGFLTGLLVDYVVWGARPAGRVPADTAGWLVTALTCCGPTGTAVAIARAIVAEAHEVDPVLLDFAAITTLAPARLAA